MLIQHKKNSVFKSESEKATFVNGSKINNILCPCSDYFDAITDKYYVNALTLVHVIVGNIKTKFDTSDYKKKSLI